MLIVGDESQSRGQLPWVTGFLVGLNALLFTLQIALGDPFTNGFSMIPAEVSTGDDLVGTYYQTVKVPDGYTKDADGQSQPQYETVEVPIEHYPGPLPVQLTLLTSMFLHADPFHLIGNMMFLLIFGRNVEHALGHARYLIFYLFCGVVAGLAHMFTGLDSVIPALGASGAISGVMGAYVAIYPLNSVKIWMGWRYGVVNVPALVVIGVWFVLQWIPGWMAVEEGLQTGTAYMAHVGGFLGGIAFTWGMAGWLYLSLLYGKGQSEEETAPEEAPLADTPDPLDDAFAEAEAGQIKLDTARYFRRD